MFPKARGLKRYFMGLARRAASSLEISLGSDREAADRDGLGDDVPSPSDLSYSAAGEDRLVLSWLQVIYQLKDASKIRYCDIGAAEPRRLNNTYILYARGASGVLIEPDPGQAQVLQRTRPRDTVLNVGVAFDERRSPN